jgi:hypothetical protein
MKIEPINYCHNCGIKLEKIRIRCARPGFSNKNDWREVCKNPYCFNYNTLDTKKWFNLNEIHETLLKMLQKKEKIKNKEIITVIGSTRFREEIQEYALKETTNGNIILSAPFAKEEIENLEEIREELEEQHFRKIIIADKILVYNKNGYLGESSILELNFAYRIGKKIEYLEEIEV